MRTYRLLIVMCLGLALGVAALGQEPETADPEADAEKAIRAKDYGQARDHLLKALVANPFNAKAYYKLGTMFEAIKKPDEAVQSYDLCLMALPAADKRNAEESNLAGSAQSRLASLDRAGQPLREAQKQFVARMVELGEGYQQSGKHWHARKAFKAARLVDPANAAARDGLARAQKALGEPGFAEALEKAAATRRGRAIGETGRSAPVDMLLISITPESDKTAPVAGIQVDRDVLKPETQESGIFFVAIEPGTGRILGSRMFESKDPVGSGARVSLFIERLEAGAIVAGVSVGAVKELPNILRQSLERVGVRAPAQSGDEAMAAALVGVKGAPHGTALWETHARKAVIRLTAELRFYGPADAPKDTF